jgi:protein SCO1
MRCSRRQLLLNGAALLVGVRAVAQEHDHSAHQHMLEHPTFTTTQRDYKVPRLGLKDSDGASVNLAEVLGQDKAVIVNFIYTSCTTVCPVMTATFLQLQRELAAQPVKPAFVSISVDPDFDTPKILKAYAARTGAEWRFLTGPRSTVLSALQSFEAWRGSKANHAAVVLMKAAGSARWTRVEGLAPAATLAQIWNGLRA